MKRLLLLLFLFIGFNSYCQDYHVKIKVEGVYDLATAKVITDPIRYKYECYPTFDVTSGYFDFMAIYDFSQEEIQVLLDPQGYTILEFYSVLVHSQEKVEEK